jgi:hypothetical protein
LKYKLDKQNSHILIVQSDEFWQFYGNVDSFWGDSSGFELRTSLFLYHLSQASPQSKHMFLTPESKLPAYCIIPWREGKGHRGQE